MSFSPYAHYAHDLDAWIGKYPAHWIVKRAHFLLTSRRRTVTTGEMKTRQVLHYSIPNVQEFGKGAIEEGIDIDSAKLGVIAPTLLVSKLNPYKLTVCLAHPDPELLTVASGEFVPIASDFIDLGYARYVWSSQKVADRLTGLTQSVTRSHQRVSPDEISKLPWAWPPIDEQRLIVTFLDRETAQLDTLIEKKRQLLKLLEEKLLTVVTHAVTKGLNPSAKTKDSELVWLGEIPEHWQVKQLRHVTRAGTFITYGIVQAGPDIEGGIPYIRTSDMAGEQLPNVGYLRTTFEIDQSYARSKVETGDLVIAIRATIGKPLIVPPYLNGANLTQGTAKFSPSANMSAEYVRFFLRGHGAVGEFRRLSKGATFKEITLEMLRKFPILQPPLDEQITIANWVTEKSKQLGDICNHIQNAIDKLREYRAALITNAVTGAIDVCGLKREEAAA